MFREVLLGKVENLCIDRLPQCLDYSYNILTSSLRIELDSLQPGIYYVLTDGEAVDSARVLQLRRGEGHLHSVRGYAAGAAGCQTRRSAAVPQPLPLQRQRKEYVHVCAPCCISFPDPILESGLGSHRISWHLNRSGCNIYGGCRKYEIESDCIKDVCISMALWHKGYL